MIRGYSNISSEGLLLMQAPTGRAYEVGGPHVDLGHVPDHNGRISPIGLASYFQRACKASYP